LWQVQASQDTSREWEQRYAALESNMRQAQAQLGGARAVLVERDELRTHLAGLKEKMGLLEQQISQEHEREALWHEQLQQVEPIQTLTHTCTYTYTYTYPCTYTYTYILYRNRWRHWRKICRGRSARQDSAH